MRRGSPTRRTRSRYPCPEPQESQDTRARNLTLRAINRYHVSADLDDLAAAHTAPSVKPQLAARRRRLPNDRLRFLFGAGQPGCGRLRSEHATTTRIEFEGPVDRDGAGKGMLRVSLQ